VATLKAEARNKLSTAMVDYDLDLALRAPPADMIA
jgi:hypothetical protein